MPCRNGAVLAQRLAMVTQVQQAGVIPCRLALQPGYRLAQKGVGGGDGVVIGVHQLAVGAVGQHLCAAFGQKALGAIGRALVIRRPAAASGAAPAARRAGAGPRAWPPGAHPGPAAWPRRGIRHRRTGGPRSCAPRPSAALACGTRSHTLAAGLVVQPQHGQAGGLGHVNRFSYSLSRASDALLPSSENMEQRGQRARTAGSHLAPAHHAAPGRARAWCRGHNR